MRSFVCTPWLALLLVACGSPDDPQPPDAGSDPVDASSPIDAARIDAALADAAIADAAIADGAIFDAASADAGRDAAGSDAGPTLPPIERCDVAPATPFAHHADAWGYELVPSVIAPHEAFYVEVTTPPGTVTSVTLDSPSARLRSDDGFIFRDDGVEPDRAAGDGISVLGPLWFEGDPSVVLLEPLDDVGFVDIGRITAHLPGGTQRQPLIGPMLGVLLSDLRRDAEVTSDHHAATDHVLETCTSGWKVQMALRSFAYGMLESVVAPAYALVEDDVDHWVFLSTQHLEATDAASTIQNYAAGRHLLVWNEATGTAMGRVDGRSEWGSTALRSVSVIDHGTRGIYAGNVTHEIVHTWSAFVDTSLGLSDGAHYSPRSSVGSLVGGFAWDPAPGGGFTRNCDEGRNGATRASPLDLYFMGLLPASSVPTMRIMPSDVPLPGCDAPIPTPHREVTVGQIIAAHGPVTPGPGAAPTHYRVGFAVEVAGRRLTPVERAFYHRLAEAYTAPVTGDPPLVGFNWSSIARFFPGSEWTSALSLR
ncbi:hypothetical protein [Sandaracinus amylolyticus]|uniref:Uncharacterized protein n=1 Tax=Sandaracinus amylolyticus TaxID=927083 RepID=A0A0F6W1N0_9BACT|nr:hypothetical protein [Sandaracinus amylolyticus]AKF05212.1 hypothetical protein DB32_002361 [Sandaracinus amylolyticus]